MLASRQVRPDDHFVNRPHAAGPHLAANLPLWVTPMTQTFSKRQLPTFPTMPLNQRCYVVKSPTKKGAPFEIKETPCIQLRNHRTISTFQKGGTGVSPCALDLPISSGDTGENATTLTQGKIARRVVSYSISFHDTASGTQQSNQILSGLCEAMECHSVRTTASAATMNTISCPKISHIQFTRPNSRFLRRA